MLCFMCRLVFLLCAALVLVPRGAAQVTAESSDPTLVELAKVKASYEEDLKALGEDLLNKLDAEVEKENAKPPAERELDITKRRLDYLKKDREALLERGEWPTSISVAEIRYHWGNDHRGKVRAAYKKAEAAAAQRGDENSKKKLADELAVFDRTNDLAPWQNLSARAELGQGERAWSRVGENFTSPLKGPAGGARNPLRFRRPVPAEYQVRFTIKWIEGAGGLVLGLIDAHGEQFDLPVARAAAVGSTSSSAAASSTAAGSTRIVVSVLRDRLLLAVDGETVRPWIEGEKFPFSTDPPGANGPEIYVGSSDAGTRFKVLSAELKCLGGASALPPANEARPTPAAPPPEIALRYDKPAVLGSLLRGLDWLIRHQDKDGVWKLESYTSVCPNELPCVEPGQSYSQEYDPGVTGLSTFALWRAWEHLSKSVNKEPIDLERIHVAAIAGIDWFAKRQKADGSFSKGKSFVYNESLATLALAEAYGATKNRDWKDPAQRAADFMMHAQRPGPAPSGGLWGWRYASRMEVEDPRKSTGNDNYEKELHDSDTSATGWAVMALRRAQKAGLEIKQENLDGAFEFAKFVTAENGLVGYLERSTAGQVINGKNDQYVYHAGTMSALGMCIRLYSQHDPSDVFLDLAARRLVADLPSVSRDKLSIDYYYWYCGTVALDAFDGPESTSRGGKYWNPWNKALVEALLTLQDKADQGCSNGAWLIPDRWSYTGGPIYSTAINALTLEDALGWK